MTAARGCLIAIALALLAIGWCFFAAYIFSLVGLPWTP